MRLLALLILCTSMSLMANEALLEAVHHDDLKKALEVLANDATVDVNAIDENGKSSLIIATEHNNEKMAWMLIDISSDLGMDLDIEIKDSFGNTASVYSHMHYNNRLFTYIDANMKERTFFHMVEFMKAVKDCNSSEIQRLLDTKNIQLEYRDIVRTNNEASIESVVEIAAKQKCVGFLDSFTKDPYLLYHVGEKTKLRVLEAFTETRMPLALKVYEEHIVKEEVTNELLPDLMMIAYKNKHLAIADEFSDSLLEFENKDIQNALFIYAKSYGWNAQADFISPAVDQGLLIAEGKDKLDAEISCGEYKLIKSNLECAAIEDKRETLVALIETGTEINNTDALHFSVAENKLVSAKILITSGADVNKADSSKQFTPLMFAVEYNNLNAVDFLLSFDADINASISSHYSAMTVAVEDSNEDMVEGLKVRGAKINDNEIADSLIYIAAMRLDIEMAEKLLELGINVDLAADEDNELTAFSSASTLSSSKQKIAMMRLLADAGANVNSPITNASDNSSPLFYNVKINDIEALEFLASLNSLDINMVNEASGYTALELGVSLHRTDSVKILAGAGAQVEREGQTAILSKALEIHAERINESTKADKSDQMIKLLEILIQGGADVNKISESYTTTPLVTALNYKYLPAAELFIDSGADVNFVDFYSETALSQSIGEMDLEFSKLLVSSDASLKFEKLDTKNRNLKWELVKKRFSLFKKGSKEKRIFSKKLLKHIRLKKRADRKSSKEAKKAVKAKA